jgi:hypothetical protein
MRALGLPYFHVRNEMVYVIFVIALVVVAIGLIWARRIEKRIEPPDRPGHQAERFHFKYGAEPPGGTPFGGGGTISGGGGTVSGAG